jgi:hypothetical protein
MSISEVADQLESLLVEVRDLTALEQLSNQLLKNSENKDIPPAQRKREALILCALGGCLA